MKLGMAEPGNVKVILYLFLSDPWASIVPDGSSILAGPCEPDPAFTSWTPNAVLMLAWKPIGTSTILNTENPTVAIRAGLGRARDLRMRREDDHPLKSMDFESITCYTSCVDRYEERVESLAEKGI